MGVVIPAEAQSFSRISRVTPRIRALLDTAGCQSDWEEYKPDDLAYILNKPFWKHIRGDGVTQVKKVDEIFLPDSWLAARISTEEDYNRALDAIARMWNKYKHDPDGNDIQVTFFGLDDEMLEKLTDEELTLIDFMRLGNFAVDGEYNIIRKIADSITENAYNWTIERLKLAVSERWGMRDDVKEAIGKLMMRCKCTIDMTEDRQAVADWANVPVDPDAATDIKIMVPTLSDLYPGNTVKLTAQVTPEEAASREIVWVSNNTRVATVSSTGLVTCVAAGTAVITVSVDGLSDSFTINVKEATIPMTSISIQEGDSLILDTIGKSITLHAKIVPENATNVGTITWSTSDDTVATIDKRGVVKAVNWGRCYIVVNAGNMNYSIPVRVAGLHFEANEILLSNMREKTYRIYLPVGEAGSMTFGVQSDNSACDVAFCYDDRLGKNTVRTITFNSSTEYIDIKLLNGLYYSKGGGWTNLNIINDSMHAEPISLLDTGIVYATVRTNIATRTVKIPVESSVFGSTSFPSIYQGENSSNSINELTVRIGAGNEESINARIEYDAIRLLNICSRMNVMPTDRIHYYIENKNILNIHEDTGSRESGTITQRKFYAICKFDCIGLSPGTTNVLFRTTSGLEYNLLVHVVN